MTRELAPKFALIFRHLVNEGSFPAFWRLADIVSVSKESSSYVGYYRHTSITPLISKRFKKIVAGNLTHFMKSNSLFPFSQFSCRRGLATCNVLLTLSHHLQVALDRGMEGRLLQLDFSAAFDGVSHCGLLYKLRSTGVGRQYLSIVSEFLNDRRQCVRFDVKVTAPVDVVSGVTQGSVLGSLLFILYTS